MATAEMALVTNPASAECEIGRKMKRQVITNHVAYMIPSRHHKAARALIPRKKQVLPLGRTGGTPDDEYQSYPIPSHGSQQKPPSVRRLMHADETKFC